MTTHPFAPVDTHVHPFLIPFYQRWSLQPSRIFEPICRSFDGREESRMIHSERRPRRAQIHSRGSTTLSATTYRCGRAKPQTKRKLGSHCRDGSGKRFYRACWRCIPRLNVPQAAWIWRLPDRCRRLLLRRILHHSALACHTTRQVRTLFQVFIFLIRCHKRRADRHILDPVLGVYWSCSGMTVPPDVSAFSNSNQPIFSFSVLIGPINHLKHLLSAGQSPSCLLRKHSSEYRQ